MKYITAFEYDELAIGNGDDGSITRDESARLLQLADSRPGFCQVRHKSVALSKFCGLVNLGSRFLEIVPKIGFSNAEGRARSRKALLRLLHDAGSIPTSRHEAAGHELSSSPLIQVFISTFLDEVRLIVSVGLLRLYQPHQEDLRVVRGRIDIRRQLTQLHNRPDLVASRFDDLTSNNLLNRAIKTGLFVVKPWIQDIRLERRWIEMMEAFGEVASERVTQSELDRLTLDRQGRRYTGVLQWVRWLLALQSPNLQAGSKDAPSLLFDMNLVFQEAVANRWRRNYRGKTDISTQDGGRHFVNLIADVSRPAIRLRPDLVFRNQGKVIAIADTKWKKLDPKVEGYLVPSAEDLYQLHAYASVYRCDHLLIVYPWHQGLSRAVECSYALPTVDDLHPSIHVVCVDLNVDGYPAVLGDNAVHHTQS